MSKAINHHALYKKAKASKVGEVIKCACCGKEFVKKQYQQAFCCGRCKDRFWNGMGDRHKPNYYRKYNMLHPERLQRIGLYCDDDGVPYDTVLAEMRDEDFPECDW